ncbi:D-alanine--D-alanine ligase [Clostridium sp. DMHC 10]|uniref:D-alanine--D-alanine ligase n=1 Tax=Clostridium sp. DMHC 10 TaxID=747377 RepID=UPI00069DBBDC|nr:D-alanine--D-alanine ligase [Clostridium sp. DMHC 10]KOF57612.1 D-alanine--D-alanine ligase [Clostridium sp. DMHC 10]
MKIGVLMGGISSEREISILSGKEIVKNLDKNKYEVYPIIINSKHEVIQKVKGMDFVILAFHGVFGEDGTIQAILNSIPMPYSGCDMLTSAICMNKKQTKRILKAENINTAPFYVIYKNKKVNFERFEALNYPMFVKPNNGGSSIGISMASNKQELEQNIKEAFKYDDEVIVEKYIAGDEYTVCMLNGEVLPILSIKSKGKFFDYKCKYTEGKSEETLAKLSNELESKIKEVSRQCWEIFDCSAYVRVDIIVNNEIPYVLELNTLPGMTTNSLFPKSAALAGMKYSVLLDKIIEYSL